MPGAAGRAAIHAVAPASNKDVAPSPFVLRMVVDHALVLSSKRPSVRVPAVSSRERLTAGRTLPKVAYSISLQNFFSQFLPRDALVHSAVLRLHVVCLLVRER